MNSGGVECTRSSRRGASLSSASLGSGLDSDGQQGHAVVTQKRKLRTPVWARLRNIHISDLTRLVHRLYPRPLLRPFENQTSFKNLSTQTSAMFLSFSPLHVLTSFLDLMELVVKGHDHASSALIISV